MAILNFQKPDKIVLQKATDFEGQFEFRPLEPGYGLTIGNALRRVLLNSLEGYAITGVRIEGVDHEFATIKGVTEDVTEMILNLKQVRFRKKVDHDVATEKVMLGIKGKTEFTANMIGEGTHSFEVMNPDLVICTMDPSARLDVDAVASSRRSPGRRQRRGPRRDSSCRTGRNRGCGARARLASAATPAPSGQAPGSATSHRHTTRPPPRAG